jgi:hypothetical protein
LVCLSCRYKLCGRRLGSGSVDGLAVPTKP